MLVVDVLNADDSHLGGMGHVCLSHSRSTGFRGGADVVGLHPLSEAEEDGFILCGGREGGREGGG